MELSGSNIKKFLTFFKKKTFFIFLTFRETKIPEKFFTFQETELSYISGNGNYLTFRSYFQSPKNQNFLYFSKKI